MIELKNVSKAFHQGKQNEFWAVSDISLQFEAEKVTVLKGPSGSGKTTLLSLVGCLSRPSSGRISLSGKDISSFPERFLTDIRRNTFGFVFQQFNLIDGLTVLDNVMLPSYPLGKNYKTLKEEAKGILKLLNLTKKADHKVEWLSGGEAQRTAIARAMINNPEVIIADEPTANLDTVLSSEFLKIITELKEQGKTVLLSSHDPRITESSVIDRGIHMHDGKIVKD